MSRKQREAFDIFKDNYSQLHEKLDRFVQDLPSKFREDVPAELQKVEVLPTFMAPSDSDFSLDDAVTVLEKWKYLSDNLEIILQKMGFCVVDYDWYKDQQKTLEYFIQIVRNLAFTLGLETPNYQQVVECPAGYGGVNWNSNDMDKRMVMKTTVQSIRILIEALNAVRN